ncbi:MAG: hypothetical protein L3J71_02510 [Victivallaceae bacterium]|nr:hypothetical protein [Victivallaceae bacterium]
MKKFMIFPGKIIINAAKIQYEKGWVTLRNEADDMVAILSREQVSGIVDVSAIQSD